MNNDNNISNLRYKILFLVSWYPSRVHPILGISIKRHAEAVSKFCDVAVLFVTRDKNLKDRTYHIEYSEENGIPTVKVYYKEVPKIPIISRFHNLIRCLKGSFLGLKLIKEKFGSPDLVHVNVALPAGRVGLILNLLKNIPFLVSQHSTGYLSADGSYKGILEKILTHIIIKKARAVTVVSNTLKVAMLDHRLKNQYFVIPNVVEIGFNSTQNFQYKNSGKKRIVNISLLSDKQKNVSGIIKAIHRILSNGRNDFELHIIGDGVDRERLEDLAKSLELYGEYVVFHGMKNQEEVSKFLQTADFLITNSNYETFSVATAETIAHGVPVVATRCGGPEDFVTPDEGILIEPNNQKELEDAIIYMLDNCHKYDRQKLIEYAKSKFSYDVVGRQFYEMYKLLLTEWLVGQCGYKVYIHPEWYVLDVGSGHNPHRRTNVLLDKDGEESPHRSGEKAKVPEGKTFILGDATDMHFFKDKEFDYVIA